MPVNVKDGLTDISAKAVSLFSPFNTNLLYKCYYQLYDVGVETPSKMSKTNERPKELIEIKGK